MAVFILRPVLMSSCGSLIALHHERRSTRTFHLASTLAALAIYSYIGEVLRRLGAVLFGYACHSPTTVISGKSWLLCTTDPGTTSSYGGALFTDLPVNMLGCFLMGLLVRGEASLGIPVDMPLAILSRKNPFQQWTVTHVALRSGLCGTLTTFASWNTQMVVMICDGKGTDLPTQWVSALFGYVIGLTTAIESFRFGRDLAVAIHRLTNPDLRREADACKNLLVNRDLPDLERRFLHDLTGEHDSLDDLSPLRPWKDSTHHHRVNGLNRDELFEIERAIIVENVKPRQALMEVAGDAGWDVEALFNWKFAQTLDDKVEESNRMELWLNLCAFLVGTGLLVWGAIFITNSARTYFIATLLTPFGTTLRWRLSRLNGSITNETWNWLPIGTYTANMIASAISCLMAAISLRTDGPLALTFISAISSGFAGSLSTVSTMVVEYVELLRALPHHASGYYYSVGSLVSAGILGVICYVWAVV